MRKKPWRYDGECCASGGPAAKTLGDCGPSGFGLGTRLARTAHAHDERIRTNPGEFGQKRMNPNPGKFGRNRAKNGQIWAKKMGKKRANETETWQNRAKPKVSLKLYSVSGIPAWDLPRHNIHHGTSSAFSNNVPLVELNPNVLVRDAITMTVVTVVVKVTFY